MSAPSTDTIRANWRCFVACGIIVLSPFQYGLDFGLIGGLQAMPGFLKVRVSKHPTLPYPRNDLSAVLTLKPCRFTATRPLRRLSAGISHPLASNSSPRS